MRADSIPRLARVMTVTVACVFSTIVGAECVRWKPSPRPLNAVPDFDGPGSFGPLHGTVTLDCLKYVGSIRKSGTERALIKDEKGEVHVLGLGSYIGEHGGVIGRIEPDAIHIKQIVNRNGRWEEVTVKLPKHADAN